jgi:rod shape-determining protein MreC
VARAARYSNRLDIGLFLGCAVAALMIVVLPEDRREPVAETLRRSVVAPLVGMQRGAERLRTAWLESEQRMLRTDTLALQAFQVHALQRENDQLRRLFGLGRSLQWGFVPAEALHPATREGVVTTLTLTAGANAGVQRYNPVLSPDGVVGYIQTVDPTISIAILYSHPDFRASGMTVDGTAYGIVFPRLSDDAGRYLLEMRGVPLRYEVQPGTLVLTAGLGGTFPKGIPIGRVIREISTPEVWTRTYLLQPSVNPTQLGAVIIMNAARSARGVESVWRNVPAVEGAVRRLVTAADSLARRDSLTRQTARAAAVADSIRRANPAPANDSTRPDSAARTTAPRRFTPAPAARPRTDTATPRRDSTPQSIVGPPAPPDTAAARPRPRPDTVRPDTVRPDTVRPRTTLSAPR